MNLFIDRNRNLLLDALKGFAMLFIVLIHVLQRTIPNFVSNDMWYSQILYLLSVPIFFFLSGISYSRKESLTPLGFLYEILKRAFTYFWPFLFFILLRIAIYQQWQNVSKAFDELMQYPVSGLWVCWIIMWLTAVLDIGLLISHYLKINKKIMPVIMISIGLITLYILRRCNVILKDSYIGYNYFMIYGVVFALGYIIGDRYFNIKKPSITIPVSLLAVSGIVILSYFIRTFMLVNFYDDKWFNYLASILAILSYLSIINILKNIPKISQIFAVMGKYSLEVYFVHLIVLKAFSKLFYESAFKTFLVSSGLFLLSYITVIIIIILTYYIPYLHFLLFGRHFSRYQFEDNFWNNIKEKMTK